ncbi:SDR family oxidoreductase [archaeon]|nr:MAG: SDR family oxidoreductase [archaeon]
MRLQDKVAIITGAASGIGRASALLFAKEGAKVVVADVNEKGREVVQQIVSNGGEAIFVKTDVSRGHDVKRMIDKTVEAFGKIDILFNNAGIFEGGSVDQTTEENWDMIISINLKSVYICSKFAMPHLLKSNGAIVNTASVYGLEGGPGAAAYCASKSGVVGLTRAMAVDCAPKVRVNCICPGPIDTPMLRTLSAEDIKSMESQIPLKRIGKPEEVANVALFLASDEASYVTGAAYTVDAGDTAT